MEKILISSDSLSLEVLTYGGIVRSIKAHGIEVAAGLSSESAYSGDTCHFGGVIGRTCNRCGSLVSIDGRKYFLSLNERGVNHLHGGFFGFNRKRWSIVSSDESSVTLSYLSPDGEEGYPGNVRVQVTYSVSGDTMLVHYVAATDAPTFVSLTNHSYFNPDGINAGVVMGVPVRISADRVSLCDETLRINGSEEVKNEFDLREEKRISREYDCNYFINGSEKQTFDGRELSFAASASGRVKINVYTDMPCMQFYTGNFIPEGTLLKDGTRLCRCGALCFEPQYEPGFQQKGEHILRPGETYDSLSAYVFEKNF